jgi:uncharacterized protein YebE (UPF0316 family)
MEPILIMVLVLLEVALWQWRIAITMRGRLAGGVALGLVGAVIQVTAISSVVQDMGNVAKIAGYAAGVGAGVLLGCLIDRRVSAAEVVVRVFAPADPALVPALRAVGWPVAATDGIGHDGPIAVLHIAIDERKRRALEMLLGDLAPRACWTVERVVSSRGLLGVAGDGATLVLTNAPSSL